MSGKEIESLALAVPVLKPADRRRMERAAAVHVADRVAAEHPDPRDGLMPKLAGRELAHNPVARADVLELLDAIGLRPDQIRRRP